MQIFESIEKVIGETAAQLRYKNQTLAGIALSTVMHSFVGLDGHHEPLMDIQTWADSRSAGIVRRMKADKELCQNFYQRTGCPVHACYPLAKILWLQKNLPELFQRMQYVGSLKDYIFLGGKSIQPFAFAMSIGVVFGTLSSIFIASPIAYLVAGKEMRNRRKVEEAKAVEVK